MSALKDYFQYIYAKSLLKKQGPPTAAIKIPLNPDQPYRFLIVSYDAIGDFILSTPTFEWLRKHFKNAQFDLVCSNRNFALANKFNYFSNIYQTCLNSNIFNLKGWAQLKKIKKNQYDFVINLFDEPDHCAVVKILYLATTPDKLISLPLRFKNTYQQKLLDQYPFFIKSTANKSSEHFSKRMLRITDKLGGAPTSADLIYQFPFKDLPEKKDNQKVNILFNPTGSQTNNTLKKEFFLKILHVLKKNKNFHIHLFQNLTFEKDDLQITTHQTETIFEAARVVQQMDLVISTDTSISHIATAAGKPLLLLRSNEDWRKNFDPLYGQFNILESQTNNINDIQIESFEKAMTQLSGSL